MRPRLPPRRGAGFSANTRCCSSDWSAPRCWSRAGSISGFPTRKQIRAAPPATGEGDRGGRAHRGLCRGDRTADRLDDACAMGRLAARPAPPGLFPAAASGAGDHRGTPARRRGARAAQGVAAGDGRDRQRGGFFARARPFSEPRPIASGSARSISASNPSRMSRWRWRIRAATPGLRSPKSI